MVKWPFDWRVTSSLRGKLLLLAVGLAGIPCVIFGVMALQTTRRALEVAIGRQLAELAHDAAAELSERFLREQRTVRAWARHDVLPEALAGDADRHISKFLNDLRAEDSEFVDVRCVGLDGTVLAASDQEGIGEREDPTAWREAILAGDDFMAGPVRRAGSDRPLIQMVVPLNVAKSDRQTYGALVAYHDWNRLTSVMTRIQRSAKRHKLPVDVVLLNEMGTVIAEATPQLGASQLDLNLAQAGWRSARYLPMQRPGFWRDPAPRALVGFAPLSEPHSGWTILVAQPLEQALAPVYRLQRRLLVLLAFILAGGVAAALLFAERLLRPLRALRRATRTLAARGQLSTPVPASSRDEIGDLGEAFNHMANELRLAQRELVETAKFAFVGEVAAGVAHEVRTPLGIMRSSGQILRRSLDKSKSADIELVDMIIDEVDRLDRVVAQLLELSRPREPVFAATPLAPLLARAADFVEGRAREANVTLRREIEAILPPAECDADQIYQVALNLLVNAIQVLRNGGQVVLSTTRGPNGSVGFEVGDNGPGIPEAMRDRIFTPFFTRRQGGTGLGLALVQRIVRAHRGQVTVQSRVGGGTTFRVELPRAREEA